MRWTFKSSPLPQATPPEVQGTPAGSAPSAAFQILLKVVVVLVAPLATGSAFERLERIIKRQVLLGWMDEPVMPCVYGGSAPPPVPTRKFGSSRYTLASRRSLVCTWPSWRPALVAIIWSQPVWSGMDFVFSTLCLNTSAKPLSCLVSL